MIDALASFPPLQGATLAVSALLIVSAAIGLGAFAKGVTGMGFPLVAVPVVANFVSTQQAVLIILLPAIALNGWQAWQHRHARVDLADGRRLFIGGCFGVIGGAVFFNAANERWLALTLVVWVSVYAVFRVAHPSFSFTAQQRLLIAPWIGLGTGVFQATTGMPGPIVGTYLMAAGLSHGAFLFGVATCFLLFASVQLGTFVVLDLFTLRHAAIGALALVPAALSLKLGQVLAGRLPSRTLEPLILAVVIASVVRLVYRHWG